MRKIRPFLNSTQRRNMSSLRFLPIETAREILSYLDFDSCALLNWTFDRRIQHFFAAGTFPRLRVEANESAIFYPAHYYLLATMKGVDTLELQSRGEILDKAVIMEKLAQLAPKHLTLDLMYPEDIVCSPIFASLQTIHIGLTNCSGSVIGFVQRLSSLPRTLQRFRFTFRSSSLLSVHILNAIMTSLPDSLVSLELEFEDGEFALGSILARVPNVENLVLKGIRCGEGGKDLKLPASLLSLTLWTCAVLTKSDFSTSNLRQLCIESPKYRYDLPLAQEALDLEKLLPTDLVHLELPAKLYVAALPKNLESLKVSCSRKEELVHCTEKLLKPLKTLRTLSLFVTLDPGELFDFSMQLPISLTCLRLDQKHHWDSETIFRFGGERLTSLPLLRLEISMTLVHIEDLFEIMSTYPHARIEAKDVQVLTQEDVEFLKPLIPALSSTLRDYDVTRLCRGIVDALMSANSNRVSNVNMSVCMCVRCLSRWFPADPQPYKGKSSKNQTSTSQKQGSQVHGTSITFPLPAQKSGYDAAPLLEFGNVIKFVCVLEKTNCTGRSSTPFTFPTALERLSLTVRASGPSPAYYDVPARQSYFNPPNASFRSILQLGTSKLTYLDFDTLPLDDASKFWTFIPRTVTHLRSKFDFQPSLQFGANTCRKWSFDNFSLPRTPFSLVLLDTPYFVYTPHQLSKLCSQQSLKTLAATIHAQDSIIFEFALDPTSCPALSFPNLKNLKLIANPIITGTLLVNFPAHVSFRVMRQEVVEAFQSLDVLVTRCEFEESISFHPRVTHAIMDDQPNYHHLSSVECVNSKSSPLVEMKIFVETETRKPLILPSSLTILELTFWQQASIETISIPAMPPQLKQLRYEQEGVSYERTQDPDLPVIVGENFLFQDLPGTLENIVLVGILPSLYNQGMESETKSKSPKPKQTAFSPLPHLQIFEADLADDDYLDSLCNLLPKTTVVKVETARLTCRLLPLDLEEFTWKAALSSCLDLEKRFPGLRIGSWRAVGSEMKVVSTCLKRACFNFDFGFDSLFDATTRARKPLIVSLVADLVELHKDVKFPVKLPASTERLEYRVTRSFFSDPSLKALSKTTVLLKPHKLQGDSVRYDLPNVTHVAFHLVVIAASSVIDYATLPVNTRVIEVILNQAPKAQKELKFANTTAKLKQVITSRCIVVKPAFTANSSKVQRIPFKVSQV